ncbi:MAG: tetratricopeptide repeat protein [Planctomycetaceae bacterium]|jgi:Flp pilus assembly protein TadD|nr:tetratricopeptide repeat protein [Planctomycetaceae bacterium]
MLEIKMSESEQIDVQYDEAIAKYKSGDIDAAIELLRQLLAKSPNYSLAHNALGVMYNRIGKNDQAIEHAKRVCEIEPDDTFGYTILSSLCMKNGRREEAEDALMQARERMIAARLQAMQALQNKESNDKESSES